ncbi:MAG: AAA family ATPase [Spirochaetes bacterium]|uniref:AAA family ATPase n=1 Tax=Candidatus Gallitreponema excrementavium TaxID=2840840 RepID=A0A9D9HQ24_9SPIR|nr:AAA family ATPase [Candidatus Gallitreponema excrementavium]
MKPVKLILNNIGPFSSENTIDFDSLGDIFLISGKTGSGKTTLFDSMFYALYGALPGTRAGTDKNLMKCQFSPPETDSFVDFTFKLNNCKYRIIRHPPFKKLSAKTGKTVPTEEKAVFYKINRNGEKEILSDKVSEIKKTVENLLGLSEEEFSSIILLPQGKFAEFLHMNSTDRKEVLSKLFPVEKYRQVILSAMEKNKINKARIEAVENQIIAIQNDFNPETAEKEIPVMENNRTELKNNMEKTRRKFPNAQKKLKRQKRKKFIGTD